MYACDTRIHCRGSNPHTITGKLATWFAPAAAGMMGMFINTKVRENAVKKNTKGLEDVRKELVAIKEKMNQVAKLSSD